MKKKNIYLREGKESIGPFRSLGDAQRFLQLMKDLDQRCNGIEIVIEEVHDPCAVTPDEKRCLRPSRPSPESPMAHLEHDHGNDGDQVTSRRVKKDPPD